MTIMTRAKAEEIYFKSEQDEIDKVMELIDDNLSTVLRKGEWFVKIKDLNVTETSIDYIVNQVRRAGWRCNVSKREFTEYGMDQTSFEKSERVILITKD